jgi:ribulose-phosphate 3-epimerase
MNKYLSASVMCADLVNLEKSIRELEKGGIDYIHIDIMDGSFVPNITLGFDLVNAVKKITDIPLDVHMMVNDPARFIDLMNLDENDILCVHYEADVHIQRTLTKIKAKGCKAGLAVNPQTPLSAFEYLREYVDMALIMTVSPGFAGQKIFEGAERKIREARAMLGNDILIEADGNMSIPNGVMASNAGADIFVLGTSSLFLKDKDIETAAKDFRAALSEG